MPVSCASQVPNPEGQEHDGAALVRAAARVFQLGNFAQASVYVVASVLLPQLRDFLVLVASVLPDQKYIDMEAVRKPIN